MANYKPRHMSPYDVLDMGTDQYAVVVPTLLTGLRNEPIISEKLTPDEVTDMAIDLLKVAALARRLQAKKDERHPLVVRHG